MAERRMFAKTIIDSDAFLDMPLSAQALYFHLSMRADDEGFINNPKKIQRMVGASEDDLKLLVAKSFIIPFESGIVVIKHWKIHNYIRGDRLHETKYLEERALLNVKENGAYTLSDICQSNVSQLGDKLDTEVRLGKDRLGKDRLGKDRVNSTLPPYEEIIKLYNSICVSLPRVQSISESRKKAIKARLNLYTIEDLEKAFRMAQDSDFLKGSNKRNWTANFDWLIKDANIAKVLDGNYSGGKRYDDTKPRQEDRTERAGLQEVYTSDDTRGISTEGVDINQIFKELE